MYRRFPVVGRRRNYEWKLRPRPYSNQQAAAMTKPVIDAVTADVHYNKHQRGYVKALNRITEQLPEADLDAANGNYSEYGELKRRIPWNHSGALLHDIYWNSFGGPGETGEFQFCDSGVFRELMDRDFGSIDDWADDFEATAKSTKLSGWVILVYDALYSGRLMNVLVDEHQNGAIWGGIPIIALDMFEHAYYHQNPADRAEYIENFLDHINWARVCDYFDEVVLPLIDQNPSNYFS